MAKVTLGKNSEEFSMFKDYYEMVQMHWDVERNDDYWEKTIKSREEFCKKHTSHYAMKLSCVYLEELERKYFEKYGEQINETNRLS